MHQSIKEGDAEHLEAESEERVVPVSVHIVRSHTEKKNRFMIWHTVERVSHV